MADVCRLKLFSIKLEPSLHFEFRFSGIQLLVVEEPSPVACIAHTIFGETPVTEPPLTFSHTTVTQTRTLLELGVKELQILTPLRRVATHDPNLDLVGRHIFSVRKARQIWGCRDMLPDCL